MKYLAIASFAAVAVASPGLQARDGWESWSETKKVDPTTTWATWDPKETPVKETTTWATWDPKKPHPPKPEETTTWINWDGKDDDKHHPYPPKKPEGNKDDEWVDWVPVYTTTVVTAITTYCAEPTKITHAGKVWTVTDKTTLTITDCPCTISVPVYTKTSTSCKETPVDDKSTWVEWSTKETPKDAESTWAAWSGKETPKDAESTWANVPLPTTESTWNGWQKPSATGPVIAKWTGAANKANVAGGLAGIAGIAALLL